MSIKQKWSAMPGSQKKKIILYGSIIFGVLLVVTASILDNGPRRHRTKVEQTKVLNSANRNLTLEDIAVQINAINQRIDQIELNRGGVVSKTITEDDVRRLIDENKAADSATIPSSMPLSPDQIDESAFGIPTNAPIPSFNNDEMNGTEEERELYVSVMTNQEKKGADSTHENNKGSYLPAGSILSFVAISGMNAPTNQSGLKNPMPALLRLRGEVIMPNGYRANLNDCMVLVSGYGQMADERAMLRTDTISCIRNDAKAVEVKIEGTIFGEDGKPGLRGKLVSKTGDVIAQMIKVGTLNTLGQMAVGVAGSVNVGKNNNRGDGNTFNVGVNNPATQAVTTSAAAGINDIFSRIAGIYEQYAQQTFPVIEVAPGRVGEIVLTKGITLNYVEGEK